MTHIVPINVTNAAHAQKTTGTKTNMKRTVKSSISQNINTFLMNVKG